MDRKKGEKLYHIREKNSFIDERWERELEGKPAGSKGSPAGLLMLKEWV